MKYVNGHRDSVADEAIGTADNEWKQMAKLALKLRSKNNNNPSWVAEQERKFTGIFKRLLEDPIEELEKEARR